MPRTPQDFVSKWKRAEACERQSVQEHFIDLCALVGHETPMQQDPSGTRFAFEMGAAKTSGGSGWAEPVDNPRVQAIAAAAKELVEQRDRWLNLEVTVTFAERPRSEAER